jgi:hypothetical protein
MWTPRTLSLLYFLCRVAPSPFPTDGQSASLSWCQAPIWSPWPDFFWVWRLRFCWCGAPSLKRGWDSDLLVQWLLDLVRAFTLASKFRRTHNLILLSHFRLPQEQVGPVLPQVSQSQSHITSDSQSSVRLGVRGPSGIRDQFFYLREIFFETAAVCYFVGRVCNLL